MITSIKKEDTYFHQCPACDCWLPRDVKTEALKCKVMCHCDYTYSTAPSQTESGSRAQIVTHYDGTSFSALCK